MREEHDIYLREKATRQDCLLMVRFGDYFEAFGDDAVKLAKSLRLTLTYKANVALCGIPARQVNSYAALIASASDEHQRDVVLLNGHMKGVGQYRWRTACTSPT